jgi:hypothetical protein
VSVHLLPAFLLPASSTPGLIVFVRPSAACLRSTCQFDSRSHSVSVYLRPAFMLSASWTPGLTVGVRLPAPCLPATCQIDSRSQSLCPSICSLSSCYLPVRVQVSQFVSVNLLPAFLLPASLTPVLTVCVRPSAPCLPASCQFVSRSHNLCPSNCCLPSCYLPVQIQDSRAVFVHLLPANLLHYS